MLLLKNPAPSFVFLPVLTEQKQNCRVSLSFNNDNCVAQAFCTKGSSPSDIAQFEMKIHCNWLLCVYKEFLRSAWLQFYRHFYRYGGHNELYQSEKGIEVYLWGKRVHFVGTNVALEITTSLPDVFYFEHLIIVVFILILSSPGYQTVIIAEVQIMKGSFPSNLQKGRRESGNKEPIISHWERNHFNNNIKTEQQSIFASICRTNLNVK